MGTVIVYVLLTLVVGAALYGLSVVVFGRSELLPAVGREGTLTRLPETDVTGRDLRDLRFRMVARGYSMQEVDWALDQAATEIDRLRAELDRRAPAGERTSGKKVSG